MIQVITEFVAKATILVRAYVYDEDEALADPKDGDHPITVTITDSDGKVQVDDKDMTKHDDTTGTYDYFYSTVTTSAKGWWLVEVVTIDGTGDTAYTSVGRCNFKVKA